MIDSLAAAVAQVKGWTPKDETWEFSDFRPENGRMPIAMAKTVATILNAVASGDLVLKADVDGLVEALNKMDVGQSQRPDHWDYRVMARSTARAALTAWENRNG